MRLRAQKRLKRVLEHFSGIRAEEAVRQPARLFFLFAKKVRKIESVRLTALPRRSTHEEDEQGTGKGRGVRGFFVRT